jgi:soluble lytic murein transglycosylase-like protein
MNARAPLAIIAAAGLAAYVLAGRQKQGASLFDAEPAPDDTEPVPGPAGFDLAPLVDDPAPGLSYDLAADLEAINNLGFTVTRQTTWKPPASAAPYLDTIAQAERDNGLPAGLLARVLHQESRFRQDIITGKVKSPAGALGIAQFMPATARERGVDPLNPTSAINGAAGYLASLFDRFGDWTKAIAAYNWGQGNVARKGLDKAPAETRAYVAQITKDVNLS